MTLPVPVPVPVLPEPPGFVEAVRAAIAHADEQRAHLAEEGDWETLLGGFTALRTLIADLRTLAQCVEDDVVRLLPAKRVEVDGLGVVEKRRGSSRRAWQSEDLLGRVIRLAVDPDGTGELPPPGEVVERLRAVLQAAVPFTASLGWRVTALRELGLDPDEWCETQPGRMQLQITDNRGAA